VRADLETRPQDWMVRTADPLLQGPVPPAEGSFHSTPDEVAPDDPHEAVQFTSHTFRHTRRRRTQPIDGPG